MVRTETVVAEDLRRAHVTVLEDLQKLQKAARPASEESLAELRARLGATQRHITKHFCFEEQNGYMDVVRIREPQEAPGRGLTLP